MELKKGENMSIIKITEESRKHLICRAQQRFKCSLEDVTKHIDSFIKVLKNQSLDAWRFSRSPVAKFYLEVDFGQYE